MSEERSKVFIRVDTTPDEVGKLLKRFEKIEQEQYPGLKPVEALQRQGRLDIRMVMEGKKGRQALNKFIEEEVETLDSHPQYQTSVLPFNLKLTEVKPNIQY